VLPPQSNVASKRVVRTLCPVGTLIHGMAAMDPRASPSLQATPLDLGDRFAGVLVGTAIGGASAIRSNEPSGSRIPMRASKMPRASSGVRASCCTRWRSQRSAFSDLASSPSAQSRRRFERVATRTRTLRSSAHGSARRTASRRSPPRSFRAYTTARSDRLTFARSPRASKRLAAASARREPHTRGSAALARNLALYPVVLAHAFRVFFWR
jgi:hypothetical protein